MTMKSKKPSAPSAKKHSAIRQVNVSQNATQVPMRSQVAARAYEIWQKNGSIHGNDQQHWLQAEKELTKLLNPSLSV